MIRSLIVAGVLALALTGCSAPVEGANDDPLNAPDTTGDETAYLIKETQIELRNGSVVTCLSLRGNGFSCDWEGATPGE